VRRTVPPSAEIEDQIDQLLGVGVGENPREALSGLAKLGARLIIQRAVEDEFDAWQNGVRFTQLERQRLKRIRYEGNETDNPRGGERRID
jgi:hypothetical protein